MRLANQDAHFHQTAHYKAKLPSSLNHAVIEIHRRTKFCLLDFPAFQSGKSIFKDEWQLGLDRAPFLDAASGFCFGNVVMNYGTLFHLNTTSPVCWQLGLLLVLA